MARALPSAIRALSLGLVLAATAGTATAQSSGASGLGQFRQGYGGARSATSQAVNPVLRDENGNLLVVNGLIQAGASSYSSASASGGASAYVNGVGGGRGAIGGATAIGNSLNVVVTGNHNTVIVTSTQTNNGNITAGTELNGNLNLDGQ